MPSINVWQSDGQLKLSVRVYVLESVPISRTLKITAGETCVSFDVCEDTKADLAAELRRVADIISQQGVE